MNMNRASTDYHNVLAHRCLNWVTGIKFAEQHFAPEEYLLAGMVLFPEMHPEMSQMMIDTIKGKLHCIPTWLPVTAHLLERACESMHNSSEWLQLVPEYETLPEVLKDEAKAYTDFNDPIIAKQLAFSLP